MLMKEVLAILPQLGQVDWISYRPARKAPVQEVDQIEVTIENGLLDDHYSGTSGNRQVTLIQSEHLDAVASMLGKESIDPALTRRNIVVSGINLLALKNRKFRVGEEVILETTGPCEPCTQMERNFGPGGYNAMRGHGGICTRVINGGTIRKGDKVNAIQEDE